MMPFFIFLDWKGWFRSDPLEEIVGLDTSYHGGCILGSSDAQPEYISAYKQRKEERRASRGGSGPFTSRSPMETALELMDEEEHNYGDTDPAKSDDDYEDSDDEEAASVEQEDDERCGSLASFWHERHASTILTNSVN